MHICFISDFFYPNIGGVECHIYNLAQKLYKRGHKIVVITHQYDDKVGIRYLKPFIKVYYIPMVMALRHVALPSLISHMPILRHIFIREQIELVHGHSAFSVLSTEGLITAKLLGIKTVFTDHSLFGFNDFGAIMTNKLLEMNLGDLDAVICVSHVSKENTVLRAKLPPSKVRVIPNAIDTSLFLPAKAKLDHQDEIIVVVMSRLVHRKGIGLLGDIIPNLCAHDKRVRFLIGGDGPLRLSLEEMRDQHRLHERIMLLGNVPNSEVPNVLVKGHIFLNTSLTEAFCMAIVEAVSCGVPVVSTAVGGIVEVFPKDLVCLAKECTAESLLSCLIETITRIDNDDIIPPHEMHDMVRNMYSWEDVSRRTEKVYMECSPTPFLADRLKFPKSTGAICNVVFKCLYVLAIIVLYIWQCLQPEDDIDKAPYIYHDPISGKETKDNPDFGMSHCRETLGETH